MLSLCIANKLVHPTITVETQAHTVNGQNLGRVSLRNTASPNHYWRASEASETLSGVTQSRFRYIWRASEASETLLVVVQWKTRFVYTYIYVYVIARVGVKFGINFTSVRLSGNKIARGEAVVLLLHSR